ncbi:MAG: hypothetical protein ABR962_05585 [Candidatus Bathyarchaeia archaeon]|jgi:hypothetical protein
MSKTESELNELVSKGIRKTVNKFREQPCIFFSEMDIHSYLYYCLYSTRFEVKTADGAVTSCLHKEYPTHFRYSKETMEDYGFTKKGVRGHYDFAILNPQFVEESRIASIVNKNIDDLEVRSKDKDRFRKELLTVIELKYVVNNSRKFVDEVEKDIKKLSIGLKYQSFEAYNLVFSNQEYYYIDDLIKVIEKAEHSIKNILVRSHYRNNKKDTPKPITNGWIF